MSYNEIAGRTGLFVIALVIVILLAWNLGLF